MQTVNNVKVDSTPIATLPWPASIAIGFRRKRFAFFQSLIASQPRPLRILDVGGTQAFWELMGFIQDDIQITILNTEQEEATFLNVTHVVGDARNMREFKDQ